jgi:transposase-like protein
MSRTQQERLDFWRQLIQRQEQSGLSVRAFCQQHCANEHSSYQWRKRFSAQLPVKFALVETGHRARVHAQAVEVILSSGERLRIPPGVDSGARLAADYNELGSIYVTIRRNLTSDILRSQRRELAFDVSVEIYKHFGWLEIPIERLKGEQAARFGAGR